MSGTKRPETGTTMVHIRLDERLKVQASEALEKMGMTLSEAVRILLIRVAREQAFPFAIKVPNATTRAAMAEVESRQGRPGRFTSSDAMFDALSKGGK